MDLAKLTIILNQWAALLPTLISIEGGLEAAVARIKEIIAAKGREADTSALDQVIAEATAAKAQEDALLDPPVSPV